MYNHVIFPCGLAFILEPSGWAEATQLLAGRTKGWCHPGHEYIGDAGDNLLAEGKTLKVTKNNIQT